jgi:hypothetical protein
MYFGRAKRFLAGIECIIDGLLQEYQGPFLGRMADLRCEFPPPNKFAEAIGLERDPLECRTSPLLGRD